MKEVAKHFQFNTVISHRTPNVKYFNDPLLLHNDHIIMIGHATLAYGLLGRSVTRKNKLEAE